VHGAGVEATGQAACYAPKREAHVVCPTNRRPFGFDWEDWGRTDFAEAFAHARATLVNDPLRSWLTGHSMGGHGTWQLGAHFPGEFAAIAPSAGWISFSSYTGANAAGGAGAAPADPAVDMLLRSGRASDTLALKENYLQQGVYVLHGDADDNVPVSEAREMFRQMAAMHHPDFAYYERCGAGHWWGNECVDWPPLTEFLFRHSLPKPESNAVVRFRTVAPQVSARSAWVRVLQQEKPFEVSSVDAALDVAKREVTVTTSNVVRLDLVPPVAGGAPVKVTVDGTAIDAPAADKVHLRLVHAAGADGKPSWTLAASQPGAREKKPARGGPFKNAFAHGFVAVVGTQGDDAADALLMAKARYDSDQWWVRGNGRFEILTDRVFDPAEYKGRNVVLYGNHDQHADWDALVGATAGVDVRDGTLAGPTGRHQGDDLAAMFVLPRADCDQGQVGVIAATGATGLRAAMRTPVFTAGVGIPDLVAFRADMLEKGTGGIVEAGFFGNDWSVAGGTWMRR
jgi:dienelactone hydrolase